MESEDTIYEEGMKEDTEHIQDKEQCSINSQYNIDKNGSQLKSEGSITMDKTEKMILPRQTCDEFKRCTFKFDWSLS